MNKKKFYWAKHSLTACIWFGRFDAIKFKRNVKSTSPKFRKNIVRFSKEFLRNFKYTRTLWGIKPAIERSLNS